MTLWQPGMRVTATRLNGVIMPWTDLDALGTYTAAAAGHAPNPPRMVKCSSPGGTVIWEFEGEIEIPSMATGSIVEIFNFAPEHRTSREFRFSAGWNTSGFYPPWIRILTSGAMSSGFAAAATTGGSTRLSLAGIRLTNP